MKIVRPFSQFGVRSSFFGGIVVLLTGCSLPMSKPQMSTEVKPVAEAAPSSEAQTASKKTFIPAKRATDLPRVSVVVNNEVQRELNELKGRHRKTISVALEQRAEHLPTISQIFEDEGVPKELLNVAFVESGFNEEARSPRGATGMWQFMKSTAKYYGLKIHVGEDQRKDIILSSLAAARHLRDLYNTFNDWYLALAAYNVGRGGVERAMARGDTRDFWELARRGLLPKETARFVPKILAASLIMKDPEAFGFESVG